MKGRLIYFLILLLLTLRVSGAAPDTGVVILDPLVQGNEFVVQKNELVTGLKDLVNDFDREIDWESESAYWSENHNIDLRLDQSCEDRSRLLSLLQTRQKLFYIYKKISVDYSEWIDLDWYKNRSYTKLFSDRGVNFITLVFDENRVALEQGFLIESRHLDDWKLFIDELLNYYARVVMTPEWQEKFERLVTLRHVSLAGNQPFNEIGFPKNKNECYLRGQLFGGNYTVGYDRGTEGWFYGFWLRRYLEGNMEIVRSILEWALGFLSAMTPETPFVSVEQSIGLSKAPSMPLSMEERKSSQSQYTLEQKPSKDISGNFATARALAETDLFRAIQICEKIVQIQTDPYQVQHCLLLLGKLNAKYERQVSDIYADQHRRQFRRSEISGRYNYTGYDFEELIRRYPQSALRDDAAYGITQLSIWGECEGYIACYIRAGFLPVNKFLSEYPGSDFSWEAVQRANSAFDSRLTNWRDLTLQTSRYDPFSVMKMLEDYDQVAAQLPGRLRFSAQMTIARLWTRFDKQTRAQEIYESLLVLDLDVYERGALSQRLAEMTDTTEATGQTDLNPSDE